mmetsp:Transcript_13569/g.29854  ORF Transcript_13569/g.29854 Transcript_13569/m.29854 type:complete len:235 (+) Transcript_13569:955-1659(+)
MGTRAAWVNVHAQAPAAVNSEYVRKLKGRSRTKGPTCGISPFHCGWDSMRVVRTCSVQRFCAWRSTSGEAPSMRSVGSKAAGSRHHSSSGMPRASRPLLAGTEKVMAFLKPVKSTSPSLFATASLSISSISASDNTRPMAVNALRISVSLNSPLPSASSTVKTSISSSRSVLNSWSKNLSESFSSGNKANKRRICRIPSNGNLPPNLLIKAAANAEVLPFQFRANDSITEASKR